MKKKLTVFDLFELKGKRQLSEIYVNNPEEAAAAEKAGIDIIATACDCILPHLGINATIQDAKDIREACPNTHLMMGTLPGTYTSPYEAVKMGYKLISFGADSVYTANSTDFIKPMVREKIPVFSHIGLIPHTNTWTGGFRAVGRNAEQATKIFKDALEIDDAGAVGIEIEVVPPKVAAEITKRVKMITISMGSGSFCDAQYLFAQDILGTHYGHYPRHAKKYIDLRFEFEKIQKKRISSFKEYVDDVKNHRFNKPELTVSIEDKEYEYFLNNIKEL